MADSELSKCSPNFIKEFNKLHADALAFNATVNAEAKAKAAIKKEVDSLANKHKDLTPNELLILLLVEVLGSKTSNAYQLQLKGQADAFNLQKTLTNLSSDTQDLTNGKGPTTMTGKPGGGVIPAGQRIKWLAADTDEMQNALGKNPSSTFSGKTWAGYVRTALGTEPCNMMTSNFANMRKDIYWAGDPEAKTYNPGAYKTAPSPTNAGSYTSYHFMVGNDLTAKDKKDFITSYAEMKAGLSSQKDPKGAQNANKILLDNFNENATTTQSMGQAANAEIGIITSAIKMNTNAVSSFSQDLLTGNRTAIRNQLAQ